LTVTADASQSTDTDATPISSYRFNFGDGIIVGPQAGATATHTYTAAGSFTVTVTVNDSGGQSSSASTLVSVKTPTGTNLVGNPGFETNTTGWNNSGRTGVTLTRVSGGHSGSYAAALTNTTSATVPDCTLNDSPNWVTTTQASTYQATVWVRADTAGAKLTLKLREYNGSTFVAQQVTTATLSTSWQQVSVSYVPQNPGVSTLDLNAYVSNAVAGTCFYADDISITTS
jgi:PKD repeat protein